MPVYKPMELRKSETVIGQYRSILDTMTSDLVEGWNDRFKEGGLKWAHDSNMASFLKEFSDFAWTYFESVVSTMPIHSRNDHENVPRIHRDLRKVIDNLQRNWGELMTACNQRENTRMRRRLEEADAEAARFYARYKGFRPKANGQEVMPITYFGARYEITRYPYTPFPLLCFRHEAYGNRRLRLNGLAHELGHFIYWNIVPAEKSAALISAHQELDKAIEETVRGRDWITPEPVPTDVAERLIFDWQNWKSEMFADVVGALLIGPKYVETSIRLYVEEQHNERAGIYAEDRVHPLPILRPLIALETVSLLSDVFKNQHAEIKRLYKYWEGYFDLAKADWKKGNETGDELAEKEFYEQRQKAHLAREQTRAIVDLFLNKALWPKLDGGKCRLIDLFTLAEEDYDDESEFLPTNVERRQVIAPTAFEQLTASLAEIIRNRRNPRTGGGQQFTSEEEKEIIYQALLNLPLAEEQGSGGCIFVRWAGEWKGIYLTRPSNACVTGYEARWEGSGGGHWI